MDCLIRFLVATSLLATSLNSVADELPAGDWKGSFQPHDKSERVAKFRVRPNVDGNNGGGSKVTMYFKDRPYQFENLNVNEGKMIFELDTGSTYDCELIRAGDGSFSGPCVWQSGEDSRKSHINMRPPKVVESDPEVEATEQLDDEQDSLGENMTNGNEN